MRLYAGSCLVASRNPEQCCFRHRISRPPCLQTRTRPFAFFSFWLIKVSLLCVSDNSEIMQGTGTLEQNFCKRIGELFLERYYVRSLLDVSTKSNRTYNISWLPVIFLSDCFIHNKVLGHISVSKREEINSFCYKRNNTFFSAC